MKSVSKKDAAKRVDWKRLILCLVLPLAVGGLAALLTGESMQRYSELAQPPFSPPGIVFPIAWTALYLLMGISSYLVCDAPAPLALRKRAAVLYILQLFLNFVWPILFFKFQVYLAAFIWLWALLGLVIPLVLAFRGVSHAAASLFALGLLCGVPKLRRLAAQRLSAASGTTSHTVKTPSRTRKRTSNPAYSKP